MWIFSYFVHIIFQLYIQIFNLTYAGCHYFAGKGLKTVFFTGILTQYTDIYQCLGIIWSVSVHINKAITTLLSWSYFLLMFSLSHFCNLLLGSFTTSLQSVFILKLPNLSIYPIQHWIGKIFIFIFNVMKHSWKESWQQKHRLISKLMNLPLPSIKVLLHAIWE